MKILPAAVTSRFGRQLMSVRKVSPQIMFGFGVVGVVTAGVMACRATLKLDEVLEVTQEKLSERETAVEVNPNYTQEMLDRDRTKLKIQTGLDVAKLYAPSVGLGLLSIGLLTGSHCTLVRRNTSIMAAYAATDKAFREYRDRVRKEAGEDKDREYRFGVQEYEETVEGKNGEKKTSKHKRASDDDPSGYAKLFDPMSKYHQKDAHYNQMFLRAQQQYANHQLRQKGWLFLNDVYDMLDIERTKAGQSVGWIYKDNGSGDGYVDFGVFDNPSNQSEKVREFLLGDEHSVLLDFNVDGVILGCLKD